MKYSPLIAVLAAVGLLSATAIASYSLARKATISELLSLGAISDEAAAGLSFALEGDEPATTEEIEEADLLYAKAKAASEQGEWLSVKALLEDSPATERIDYEQYAAALLLLTEAVDKVSVIEATVADELQALRDEAAAEQAARQAAESAKAQTAAELSDTKQAQEAQEAALLKKISESEEEKQEALKKAQEEANTAFINELDVYIQLMERGDSLLRSAEDEAEASRDAQSLVFIKQAEDLFDQVEKGGEGLRDERTPSKFSTDAAELLRAVGIYSAATKHYRTMVANLPDKGDAYDSAKSSAIAARLDGLAIMNVRKQTVANEQ